MGTKGTLEIPEPFWGNPGSITVTTPDGKEEIPVAESDRFRAEIEDFAGAILEDRPPMLDPGEAIRNQKVIKEILIKAGFTDRF